MHYQRFMCQTFGPTFVASIAVITAAHHSANGAVISAVLNHAIPVTAQGTFINVETGAMSDISAASVPGWDVNPYGNTTTSVSLWASLGGGYMRNPGTTASFATRIDAGTTIGASQYFYGGTAAVMGTGVGQWLANSDGYFGFKFAAGNLGLTYYGWAKIRIGINASDRTLVSYGWENTAGGSIVAGQLGVPAPGAIALLALAGLHKGRRRSVTLRC